MIIQDDDEKINTTINLHFNEYKKIRFGNYFENNLIILSSVFINDNHSAAVFTPYDTPDFNFIKAATASASLPMFFSPIYVDKFQYLDGGILNNVPLFVFSKKNELKEIAPKWYEYIV